MLSFRYMGFVAEMCHSFKHRPAAAGGLWCCAHFRCKTHVSESMAFLLQPPYTKNSGYKNIAVSLWQCGCLALPTPLPYHLSVVTRCCERVMHLQCSTSATADGAVVHTMSHGLPSKKNNGYRGIEMQ